MVWYGMVSMVWYGMVRYGMVRYGMVRYGTVWYGMVWYGMVWYGMVWYGMVQYELTCQGMGDYSVTQHDHTMWERESISVTENTAICILCRLTLQSVSARAVG